EATQITYAAHTLTHVGSEHCLTAVLYYLQPMPLCYGHNKGHFGRQTKQVDRNNSSGSSRDLLFDFKGVDVEGVGIHVHENGLHVVLEYDVRPRDEGCGRHQHFVAVLIAVDLLEG